MWSTTPKRETVLIVVLLLFFLETKDLLIFGHSENNISSQTVTFLVSLMNVRRKHFISVSGSIVFGY